MCYSTTYPVNCNYLSTNAAVMQMYNNYCFVKIVLYAHNYMHHVLCFFMDDCRKMLINVSEIITFFKKKINIVINCIINDFLLLNNLHKPTNEHKKKNTELNSNRNCSK
jgi:hypothetical protein